MKKLFYSEILRKYYDTEEDCLKAEEEYNEKHKAELVAKEERASEAKEVERLFKEANVAYDKAQKALSEFCKKYKNYHFTVTDTGTFPSIFDYLFKNFWL